MGQRITFRSVSIKYKVTIGTLFARVEIAKNPPAIASKRRGPSNFLTDAAERSIVELMLRRDDKRHPQFKFDLQDVEAMIVKIMPMRRRSACSFRDGRPGDKWTSRFIKRYAEMHLGRVSRNQEIRFRHCNGDALTTHLASMHDIIKRRTIPFLISLTWMRLVAPQEKMRKEIRKEVFLRGTGVSKKRASQSSTALVLELLLCHAFLQMGRTAYFFLSSRGRLQ
eukprot:IDg23552t1